MTAMAVATVGTLKVANWPDAPTVKLVCCR
jgi:hypothetical protein